MSATFQFTIRDVAVFDMPPMDITTSDPYVKFDFATGQKQLKTEVIQRQLNCAFAFKDTFKLTFKLFELQEKRLIVETWDKDRGMNPDDKMGSATISMYNVVTGPQQFDMQLMNGSAKRGRVRFVLTATLTEGLGGFAQMTSGIFTESGVAFPVPQAGRPLPKMPALPLSGAVALNGAVSAAVVGLSSPHGDQFRFQAVRLLRNLAQTEQGRRFILKEGAVAPLIDTIFRAVSSGAAPKDTADALETVRVLLKDSCRTFYVRLGKKDHTHKLAKKGVDECFIIEEKPGYPLRKLKLIRGDTYTFKVTTPASRVFYLTKHEAGTTEKRRGLIFGRRTQQREEEVVTKYHDVLPGVTGAGNYGEPGTTIFTPEEGRAYHKSHANRIYWGCRDLKLQYMGGKIDLLDASHSIRSQITDNVLRALQAALHYAVKSDTPDMLRVQQEVLGIYAIMFANDSQRIRGTLDTLVHPQAVIQCLQFAHPLAVAADGARYLAYLARNQIYTFQIDDINALLAIASRFADDANVVAQMSLALRVAVYFNPNVDTAGPVFDFLLSSLNRFGNNMEVVLATATALKTLSSHAHLQPLLSQRQGDQAILRAMSVCINTPDVLMMCLGVLSNLMQYYGKENPAVPVVQMIIGAVTQHYNQVMFAASCFEALSNVCINPDNLVIVQDIASQLNIDVLTALCRHGSKTPVPPQTFDVSSSSRCALLAVLLNLVAARTPTLVQLGFILEGATLIASTQNLALVPLSVEPRVAALNALLNVVTKTAVASAQSTPLERIQAWNALASAGYAVQALAANDSIRDMFAATGARWIMDRINEAITQRENKKKETPKKKDRNAHNNFVIGTLNGLGALCSSPTAAMALREVGVVEVVLKLIRVYSKKTPVLTAAVPVIAGFSSDPSVCEHLGEKGGVQAVLRCLRNSPKGLLLDRGIDALMGLSRLRTNRLIIIAYGGVHMLVEVTRRSGIDARTLSRALDLLTVLAEPTELDQYPSFTPMALDMPLSAPQDAGVVTGAPVASAAPMQGATMQTVNPLQGAATAAPQQQRFDVRLQFSAKSLPKADFFGKADPYLTVSAGSSVVLKTEVIQSDLNPRWVETTITGQLLCNYNYDAPLTIDIYDWDRVGEHSHMATLTTTLRGLMSGKGKDQAMAMVPGGKKHSATLCVDVCDVMRV
eukprot:TRINITY_DN4383_c0_g5_i1.p1 TRINITY_DN4383_c0_g5~~TRINITY_DN4383_c0_g5_i1.p1  ORF type:complete len:1172 (+),score=319.72 TRINITY_DN4383_c0_g5_i1:1214-4729(+)